MIHQPILEATARIECYKMEAVFRTQGDTPGIWAQCSARIHPHEPTVVWRNPWAEEKLPPGHCGDAFPSWAALYFFLLGLERGRTAG